MGKTRLIGRALAGLLASMTAGRLIKPVHCPSCGSPDQIGGRCFNCEEWEWLVMMKDPDL